MLCRRNTHQKELILAVLRENPCHPTAGEVYELVRQRCATISRSTVFRVLANQAEAGAILRLHLDGEADRYDAAISPHCHIRCRCCGRVADLPWAEPAPLEETAGFLVEGCTVSYHGLCPSCQGKNSNAEKRL